MTDDEKKNEEKKEEEKKPEEKKDLLLEGYQPLRKKGKSDKPNPPETKSVLKSTPSKENDKDSANNDKDKK